jgi:hypothetical protein
LSLRRMRSRRIVVRSSEAWRDVIIDPRLELAGRVKRLRFARRSDS